MEEALYHSVVSRLLESDLSDAAINLVDAACEGEGQLDKALADLGADEKPSPPAKPADVPDPPSAFLDRIEVAGFRGIGPKTTLRLNPGPGLTVVLGRNGSGKSSFAEGLEVLLTGTSRRWENRTTIWKDGWRCLHASGPTAVAATFAVEGSDRPVTLTRTWPGEDLGTSQAGGDSTVEKLGWKEPLRTFRPLLSSRDLSKALESGPSAMFDSMKSILGLGEVTAAVKRLGERRRALAKAKTEMNNARKALLPSLASDDPRAVACHKAVAGRKHDLDLVEEMVLGGNTDDDGQDQLRTYKQLANLPLLDVDLLDLNASKLRSASTRMSKVAGTQADAAAKLADLVQKALDLQGETDQADCPVCKQPLPEDWRAHAAAEVAEARSAVEAVIEANRSLDEAIRAARRMSQRPPPALAAADVMDLGSDAGDAWAAWLDAPNDPVELAAHLEDRGLALVAAVKELREAASKKLVEMQDAWRPVATELAAWLQQARAVEAAEERRIALTDAEKWLKGVEGSLRDDRLKPIADNVIAIWNKLRQRSSVDLTGIHLAGSANRRKVELDVTIDGQDGAALGVMSQGELNALALSLFLPRMLMDESPFGFVVIDDPINSMDPSKVDGLAEVLGDAAKTRQVIVLTHDPRLGEALGRLKIDATVLRVARRDGSRVEVSPWVDPVQRHLQDARRLAHEEDTVGTELASQLVPGFCRMAVEAACAQTVRRKRLGRGDPHEEVEAALAEAHGTHALVTLALFDDPGRHGDTYSRLNNQHASWAVDLLKLLNTGTHHGWTHELHQVVGRAAALAEGLRA